MITPIIAWLAVATIVVIVALCGIFRSIHDHQEAVRHPFIDFISEKDEFWVPGDRNSFDEPDEGEDL